MPSTDVFEHHFGAGLGLSRDEFVKSYANDFLFELGSAIQACGWDVSLVIPSMQVSSIERHTSRRAPLEVVFVPVPRMLWHVPGKSRRGRRARWLWSRAATRSRELWLVLHTFDVVYVQEYSFGRFFEACRRVRPSQVLVGAYHGAPIAEARWSVLQKVVHRADLLLSLTDAEAASLGDVFGSEAPVEVLGNPVRTDVFLPSGDERSGSIWVGRIVDRHKGLSVLLEAVATIPPDAWAPLRIVGDGPDRTALMQRADRLGLTDRVAFVPFQRDRVALANLYASARFAVFPSYYEGLPLAVIEAQACGTPVVASDLPALRTAGDTASAEFSSAGDSEDLAAAILRMHRRLEGDPRIGIRSARPFVDENFSAEAVGHRLNELLRRALRERVKRGRDDC